MAADGNVSTASGSASATVIKQITLTHTSGAALSFGKFTRGTGGTVVVSTSGVGSTTSGVAFVPGSSTTADQFQVQGDPNRSFSITTVSGTVTTGGASMNFSTNPSAASKVLSSSGAASFSVGGTLSVPATIAPGNYTGSYSVTVTYN